MCKPIIEPSKKLRPVTTKPEGVTPSGCGRSLAIRNHDLHRQLDRHRVAIAKIMKETIRWGAMLPEGYLLRVRDILAEVI